MAPTSGFVWCTSQVLNKVQMCQETQFVPICQCLLTTLYIVSLSLYAPMVIHAEIQPTVSRGLDISTSVDVGLYSDTV